MELSTCPSSLHLVLFFVPLSLILLLIYKPKSSSPAKLPPGKSGWPIVGETLEYILAGRSGNPERFINNRTRKHSRTDVFKTSLFGEKMAVFCGAAGNKFLFSNENKIVTTWWPQSTMKVLHIPSHIQKSSKGESKHVATFLGEFLKPEALQHYVPIMDSVAKRHIEEKWAQNSEVKVFPLSKNYTFALAGQLFMKINDPKHLVKVSDPFALVTAGLTSVPLNFPGTAFNRAIKASKIVIEELAAIIKQRKMELLEKRGSEGIDLLTRMLLFRDENGKLMNEIEISSQIMGLLIASHDTTSTAITFVVNYLADFPDTYSKVLKEQMEIAKSKGQGELLSWDDIQKMKYSWCVANEAMRLAPPSQGSFREAKIDFTYAGFTIPKGWKTHWTTYSTHKNPIYFPNPEKFDPSRFEGKGPAPYTFVPFGGGPRMCPGREYARLEILVFMHNVVTRFKLKKIIPDEKITYNPSPIPVNGLPVRLQPHEK